MNSRTKKIDKADPESSLVTVLPKGKFQGTCHHCGIPGHKMKNCHKKKRGDPKKTIVAAAAVADTQLVGYSGFCKKKHKGGLAYVPATKCWKQDPDSKSDWVTDLEKQRRNKESSGAEIIVPHANALHYACLDNKDSYSGPFCQDVTANAVEDWPERGNEKRVGDTEESTESVTSTKTTKQQQRQYTQRQQQQRQQRGNKHHQRTTIGTQQQ